MIVFLFLMALTHPQYTGQYNIMYSHIHICCTCMYRQYMRMRMRTWKKECVWWPRSWETTTFTSTPPSSSWSWPMVPSLRVCSTVKSLYSSQLLKGIMVVLANVSSSNFQSISPWTIENLTVISSSQHERLKLWLIGIHFKYFCNTKI